MLKKNFIEKEKYKHERNRLNSQCQGQVIMLPTLHICSTSSKMNYIVMLLYTYYTYLVKNKINEQGKFFSSQ